MPVQTAGGSMFTEERTATALAKWERAANAAQQDGSQPSGECFKNPAIPARILAQSVATELLLHRLCFALPPLHIAIG